MSTTPKPEHVALAVRLSQLPEHLNVVGRHPRRDGIAQAIADSEEHGREAGIREAVERLTPKVFKPSATFITSHPWAWSINNYWDRESADRDRAKYVEECIAALLDVKP